MSQASEGQNQAVQTPPTAQADGSILGGGSTTPTSETPLLGGGQGGTAQDGSKGDGTAGGQKPDQQDGQTPGNIPGKALQPGAVEGLAPLPDNASDEQRADFDKKLRALSGVPQDADGYGDFGFGEEIKINTASEDYKYYTKLFHEAGISKVQAKKLLEGHQKFALEQVEHYKRAENDTITEYRAKVKRDFIKECGGEEAFREFNDVATRGFMASAQGAGLTEKDIKGLLSVMGDDPRFIKIFNSIGKMHREDVLITGAAPRVQEKSFEDMFSSMFKGA